MGELDPGQGGEVDDVFPQLGFDQLVGHAHIDHFLRGLVQEKCQVFKVRDVRKTEGTVIPVYQVAGMQEAVQLAADIANDGDTVLLSPACSSFDMFKDYEARGRSFKDIVNNLLMLTEFNLN